MGPTELAQRWPLPHARALGEALLADYADPRRGYHDVRHLAEVLDRLAELGAVEEPAVVLAAWYHDAVYEGSGEDEERSARRAERELAGAGVAADVVAEVARLVRLTATHRPDADDEPGQALCDADLAILAAPVERYRAYVEGVRREYAAVPDADFRRGRAAVLSDLLAKPTLFHTDHARRHWEARARANMTAEVRALLSAGPLR